MKRTSVIGLVVAVVLVLVAGVGIAFVATSSTSSPQSAPPTTQKPTPATATGERTAIPQPAIPKTVDGRKVTTINLQSSVAYTPRATQGGTDDYHCTLVNPHLTTSSYIVGSDFFPESNEVHHSILFLVPPNLAATALAYNKHHGGWSCFGESALPGTSPDQLSNTPWLAAWAPGAGRQLEPVGTGMPIAAGSLVVMQIHYNLLIGKKPVRSKMQLYTVPATTPLKPLGITLYAAPPDLPCPAGVHGPLCNRAASLVDLGKRFGQSEVDFVNLLERICGRDPVNPPGGDSTSCTYPVGSSGNIVKLSAHMHLLGHTMKIVLNPGTPQAKTLLDVTNYNFHFQRGYTLKTPVAVHPGDQLQITCSYEPKLRQELPILRNLAPRYVTWGDGSSDEMCLGIVLMTPAS